jgi:hypothetical protein
MNDEHEDEDRISHERVTEQPVIEPDAPFRTMKGNGKDLGIAPGMASRSNGMPSTEAHDAGRKR